MHPRAGQSPIGHEDARSRKERAPDDAAVRRRARYRYTYFDDDWLAARDLDMGAHADNVRRL